MVNQMFVRARIKDNVVTVCAVIATAALAGAAACSASSGDDGSGSGGATTLPIDCRSSKNANDPRCAIGGPVPYATPGTIGTGPALSQVGVGGCTVDTAHSRLVISASTPSSNPPVGGLLGVDLTTGNRTLLSGVWSDPRTGAFTQGSGPDLTSAGAVHIAADGSYVVLTSKGISTTGAPGPTQLVGVDPASGARTLLFDASTHTAASDPCTGISATKFVLGADGTAYFTRPYINQHQVVAEKNDACHVVFCPGCTPPVGTGPDFQGEVIDDTQVGPDGNLWVLGNFGSLVRIDPTTGNYVRVSSSDSSAIVGTGPVLPLNGMLTFLDGAIYAIGIDPGSEHNDSLAAQVDPTTGNRTGLQTSGFVSVEVDRCWTGVPGKSYIAATSEDQAIGLYEPSSGNAVILSD